MTGLTHVCIRDNEYGWRRITVEEASEMFSTTVSANERYFICELCGQYVTFTKEGGMSRHFRHSRGEENKDCEERTEQYNRYPKYQYGCFDFPIKLLLENGSIGFLMGVPKAAMPERNFFVRISGTTTHTFNMKERRQDNGITWLPLQQDISPKYTVDTGDEMFYNWPNTIPGINPLGTMFDSRGNKILHEDDEVEVGKDYYLVTNRYAHEDARDISIKRLAQKTIGGTTWRVYTVRAKAFSPDSVRYFILYKLHLSKKPIDLQVIWPMTVEEGVITYHNTGSLYIAYNSNEKITLDMMPYSAQAVQKDMGGYFQVQTTGLQNLVAYKGNNGLRSSSNHLMLWKRSFKRTANIPTVGIFDKNNELLMEETYAHLPPRNEIIISARYDGTITHKSQSRIKLVQTIKGGDRYTLSVSMGDTVEVTQGCDIIRKIVFKKSAKEQSEFLHLLLDCLKKPTNSFVTVSHRFGKCMDVLPEDEAARKRISTYIRQGKMPKNVYTLLVKQLQNKQ